MRWRQNEDEVTMSALVTNIGDLRGTHKVILKIDDVVEDTKEVKGRR